jgi:DNA-binding MarR family transcriptional regulator
MGMTPRPDDSVVGLDNRTLRLWLRLLGCTRLIENVIRTRLRETFDTTLPRFDVMAQLYRFPDGMRMGEISQRLMVTGGNITGIIDQLVQEELVERVSDPQDRRAYVARLTEAGKAAFEGMALEHRGWVSDLLGGLTEAEQHQLFELLTKLRDRLHE